MRYVRTKMVWLRIGFALLVAGCSGEWTPSFVDVSPPGDEQPTTRDALTPPVVMMAANCPLTPASRESADFESLSQSNSNQRASAWHICCQRPGAIVCRSSGLTVEEGAPFPAANEAPKGALIMAGGGLRFDNADVWARFVQLAADYARDLHEPEGTRPRIAVFPTAAFYPQQTGGRIVSALQKYGADAFMVPIALHNCDINPREAVRDPDIVAQIETAHGVFFSGGQQGRIVDALRADDGSPTPALEAIWQVYRAGGVVGGSSAGTAVMSQIMCRAVESQLAVLEEGITPGHETTEGFGFLDRNWFVDQHFIIRARFARALAVTQHHSIRHGLGVDENTALLVRQGETEVIGYRGAIFLDLSDAAHDPNVEGFNIRNARVSYLDRGDRLNMETLLLIPSQEKQAEPVIDPTSPSFEPDNDERIFTTDILGNSTLLDVMRRLMNNRRPDAIGLAFDGGAAKHGPVPAFEFRLYRDTDTRAWPPGAGEDFTIANVHLDVRRVQVERLAYR